RPPTAAARPAARLRRDSPLGPAFGEGESSLGLRSHSRRLGQPGPCVALLAIVLPAEAENEQPKQVEEKKLRVVVLGAHPDDPESGCDGLIALLTKAGHEVICGYMTCYRGDRKIGKEPEAQVRRREATAACQILGAKRHFFDYAHEKLLSD